MYRYFVVFILIGLAPIGLHGQQKRLLGNLEAQAAARKSVQSMYNWDFEEAERSCKQLEALVGDNPGAVFTRAMIVYWKNAPLKPGSDEMKEHLALLEKASTLADNLLAKDENDIEGVFFKMASRSVIMRHLDDNGETMKALGEARILYKLVKQGFEMKDSFVEFYMTTGCYNYFRVAYPEKYPIYKPLAFFFEDGDRELGLEQLKHVVANGAFTVPEALNYLTYIHLKFENDIPKAEQYALQMTSLYPSNLYFELGSIEVYLFSKNFPKALPKINRLLAFQGNPYYRCGGYAYLGLVTELFNKDYNKAFEYYSKAEKLCDEVGLYSKRFKTYIYIGLSRHYARKGDQELAKSYESKAKDFDYHGYLKTLGN